MRHPTLKLKIHDPDRAISVDGRAVTVCEIHADVLIVRDGDLRSMCPLCEAIEATADLEIELQEAKNDMDEVESELDRLYDENIELSAEVDSLNATISEFENVVDEPILESEL